MISNSTLMIGILARDCIVQLRNNIPRVEELGSMFRDYYVVVYENDSVDGTKERILQWANENTHVIAISEKLHQITIPPKNKQFVKPSKSLWRIQKMAGFRNRILEEVNKKFSPNFFCFIDIDIEYFIPSSVVDAIEKAPADWGAVCASGHLYYSKRNGSNIPSNFQYDAYAFFPEGSLPEKMGLRAVSHKWHLIAAWNAEKLVRQQEYSSCRSAFNGLAFYKWDVMKNLRYSAIQNEELKKHGLALCEHLSLHSGIINIGHKVYITNKMEVVYLHQKYTLLRRFNNWYNVLLSKLYHFCYRLEGFV